MLGAWCFRRGALTVVLIFLALPRAATACRYNIREIGFVDDSLPRYELMVFVHGDEQRAWLPEFQSAARSVLGRSNVVWNVIDEVQNPSAPELRFRAQLGPRLPGAMMHLPGRDDGWPMYLHATGDELSTKLKALVASPSRAQVTAAVIDTYGAVLLLRSTDDTANDAARNAAQAAIKATEGTLADLPKRISQGPRLIEVDPSLPDEQPLAWSLGANGKDLAQPVIAVFYGRGRLAGPALRGATLTETKIREQLAVIGADCECTMDHSWMTAGSVPIAFSPPDETRLASALGFDPAAASVKAEISQILATQSRIAADPNAPRAAGYRETPLEIVPIAPGAPAPSPSPAERPTKTSASTSYRWIAAAILSLLALALAVWKMRRAKN